ncbi:MAG: (d)CMP kinase [Akkermansiaceae bacterium]|nr:(d)CMP kinase [Akkermansiaceae bacterium]
MSFPAIAIDGPAASGKSTVAGRIAARLNYTFINTGAMYRAVAWRLLQTGVDPACVDGVEEALPALSLSFEKKGTVSAVVCEGRVLDEELRAPSVNAVVSMVAAVPAVRAFLVEKQREYNLREPVVMEGRDIGTAVFPDSRFKYFVTASEEVRAARRAAEGVVDSIAERDRQDASRAVSPLAKAPDALLVDTSDMTIDEVVDFIIRDIRSKL